MCRAATINILRPLAIRDNYRNHPTAALAANLILFVARGIILIVALYRRPFFLYVDEFHSFTTQAIADLLSETRKYGLGVILSQQHTKQNDDAVFASVLGNAGTMICFRVGAGDAPLLARSIGFESPKELTVLPNHRAFVRLLLNGAPTHPFTMTTMPPPSYA